jgi:hypothetical protein
MSTPAEHHGRARGWGWAVALAAGAFLAALSPLSDGDLWWHLAAGREIVRTHALPVVDTFSSGAAGRPWIDVHWGFQLAAYALHALGGLRALVLGKAVLVAVGALILFAAVGRGAGPRARAIFAASFVAALVAARGLLLLRPVIPTLVLLAAFFYLLERFRREGRLVLLAPLPLLQVVWANVQGLSMLGPGLVGAYAVAMAASSALGARPWFPFAPEAGPTAPRAGVAARGLAGAFLVCVAACAATPYGRGALLLPFELLHRLTPGAQNVYAANVAENVPPWIVERTSPGQLGHLWIFLALLGASLVAARRPLLSHVLVLAALVGLALAANRNVLLLYWLGTPIGVLAATPALRRLLVAARRLPAALRRRAPVAARVVGRVALTGAVAVAAVAAAREPSLAEAAPFRVPQLSERAIAARGGTGTIFAADQYGGSLIWALGPAWKPYLDTRLVLRTPEEFAEVLGVVDEPVLFDAWEERHPMDYVVLPVGYPDRYLGLVAHLYASPRWRLVETDGTETLFARRDGAAADVAGPDLSSAAVVDGLRAALDRRFAASPALVEAARLQLAMLELAVGEAALGERALGALASPAAERMRARCLVAAGELGAGERIAARLVAQDGDDVRSLDLLAVIAARRGDPTKAVAFLRRALEVNPFDLEAGHILETWEESHADAR